MIRRMRQRKGPFHSWVRFNLEETSQFRLCAIEDIIRQKMAAGKPFRSKTGVQAGSDLVKAVVGFDTKKGCAWKKGK